MEDSSILEDVNFVTLYGGVTMLNIVAALYLLLRRGNAIAPEVTSPVKERRRRDANLRAERIQGPGHGVVFVSGDHDPVAAAHQAFDRDIQAVRRVRGENDPLRSACADGPEPS